jgi:hypothetical protein
MSEAAPAAANLVELTKTSGVALRRNSVALSLTQDGPRIFASAQHVE